MSLEAKEKTLGKVTEVIIKCANFFDWDWCNVNCPLYEMCSLAHATHSAKEAVKK